MTDRTILIIHLNNTAGVENIRAFIKDTLAEGTGVTVLASAETAKNYADLPVSVWPDGVPRGAFRLLALVRRISWGQFAAIYDFDDSLRTRAYRWCIRPCPVWHILSPLARVSGGTADTS